MKNIFKILCFYCLADYGTASDILSSKDFIDSEKSASPKFIEYAIDSKSGQKKILEHHEKNPVTSRFEGGGNIKFSRLNDKPINELLAANEDLEDDNLFFVKLTDHDKEKRKDYLGLSIDGGGVRGICPTVWLSQIENNLKDKFGPTSLYDIYDCMSGTSIGGITVLGLASGKTAKELMTLIETQSDEIFQGQGDRTGWYELVPEFSTPFLSLLYSVKDSIKGVFSQKYSRDGLNRLLENNFGNFVFNDVRTDVLVTSCTTNGKPYLFSNSKQSHKDIEIADIARATSAAPTYFEAHKMYIDGEALELVDGGIWVNNPSFLTAGYLMRKYELSPTQVHTISLGTGYPLSPEPIPVNSKLINVSPIISSLMSSHSKANHHSMKTFFGRDNYDRFDIELKNDIALDSTRHIPQLKKQSESLKLRVKNYVESKEEVMRKKLETVGRNK